MVRMQIQFSEEQARELKRLAAEREVSVAALTREAVDRWFTEEGVIPPDERARRALEALGKFSSDGDGDIARNHDRYLAEIYGTTG
jgi:hypothetical protein